MGLTKTTVGVTNISDLSSTPNATEGLTAAQLQAKFDKTGSDLKTYINDTLTAELDAILTSATGADLTKLHEVTASSAELNYVDGVTSAIQTQIDSKLTIAGTVVGTLADDAATSFTPTNSLGIIFVGSRSSDYPNLGGVFMYRCTPTKVFCTALALGSATERATGVLSGTTGTDGKFTVSAHTDGKIYFENRLNIACSFTYIAIGS